MQSQVQSARSGRQDPFSLTFLQPTQRWATTAKTYSSPTPEGLQAGYQLSKYFTWERIKFESLQEFAITLTQLNRHIAIYGVPHPTLPLLSNTAARTTDNFPYPDDQILHVFDLDAWPIPKDARDLIKPSLTDPQSMAQLVRHLLTTEGFTYLSNADLVIVLTSSQWTLEKLNCHVYAVFDAPVRVETLREYATALRKVAGRTVIDPAIYKSVQPQYFNAPVCQGFEDPLQGKRVIYSPGQEGMVSAEAFQQDYGRVLKLAGWEPGQRSNILPPIADTWAGTLQRFVGPHGINEPSYRAAAQLVQSIGAENVRANLDHYAKKMHDIVWERLLDPANKSSRGGPKDKQTYTVARFKQYLQSALQKNFGSEVDQRIARVQKALDKALQDRSLAPLTDADTVQAMVELESRWYSRWLPVRQTIIDSGLIKSRELGRLMKTVSTQAQLEGPVDALPPVNGDNANAIENALIEAILSQYEKIQDHHGSKYLSVAGNGDGGYKLNRVSGDLVNLLYARGLALSGGSVSPLFGKKALSKLIGDEMAAVDSIFQPCLIGTRVVTEGELPGDPVWWNLSRQADGVYRSLRIDPDSVSILKHVESRPRWFAGTVPLIIATEEQIQKRFGSQPDLTRYLLEKFKYFFSLNTEEAVKMLTWAAAAMTGKGVSYLLEIVGTPSSGKSTAADLLKDLTDPSPAQLGSGGDRTAFHGVSSDFIADIESRWVTIIDNISSLTKKEQDLLCQVATGLRHNERILYTQSQMQRVIKRPLIFTCLAPVVTRPDLSSRVLTVTMSEAPFRPEYIKEWGEEKPFMVAALAQLVSRSLRYLSGIKKKPKHIPHRDVYTSCVYSAIQGTEEVDFSFMEAIRQREAVEYQYDVGFVGILCRYLESEYDPNEPLSFSTRGLHHRLQNWVQDHIGDTINGRLIEPSMLPRTGRGMGWEVAKYIHVISRLIPWEYDHVESSNNGKRYIFKPKKKSLQKDKKTVDTPDINCYL